jgi:hypothetical protein
MLKIDCQNGYKNDEKLALKFNSSRRNLSDIIYHEAIDQENYSRPNFTVIPFFKNNIYNKFS